MLTVVVMLAASIAAFPLGAQQRTLTVPSMRLDAALTLIARLGQIDVVSIEDDLAATRSHRVVRAASAREALEIALRGTGFRLVTIDGRSFRVVHATTTLPRQARRQLPSTYPPADIDKTDVIVTASKQSIPLRRYPGAVTLLSTSQSSDAASAGGLDEVAPGAPVLQTTGFGPGRDKLFIRGIADSSFNGAAQSTASIYVGDVQLNFSGSDPDLNLFDMKDVEILEGPQGTLYGAGSIGGVVRLTPAPPALDVPASRIAGGVTGTLHGAIGNDLAGMINIPLLVGAAGLRAVAYHNRQGGYIDDVGTGGTSVNNLFSTGGRLAIRLEPRPDWRIDLSGLFQRIDAADAQYADRTVGDYQRRSYIAQPYDNEVVLGGAAVSRDWHDGLKLLMALGYSHYVSHNSFDATVLLAPSPPANPVIYRLNDTRSLASFEGRLSRSSPTGDGWILGINILRNVDSESRVYGAIDHPADIIGVSNATTNASMFAEGTMTPWRSLALTGGMRLTTAQTFGQPSYRPIEGGYVEGRSTYRLDPTLALSWALAPSLSIFARAQTGYRTGGLAVSKGIGKVADFQSDAIRVGELGFRLLRQREIGLSLTATVAFSHWSNIQADLVGKSGLPYTSNIGSADIETVEVAADWIPTKGWKAGVSALQTQSRTAGALADTTAPSDHRLPDTPSLAFDMFAQRTWQVGSRDNLQMRLSGRYQGRSIVGPSNLLAIGQGDFWVANARIGWQHNGLDVSVRIDNLADCRGNLFSAGNPFQLATRNLVTPLRPRSVRLGFGINW